MPWIAGGGLHAGDGAEAVRLAGGQAGVRDEEVGRRGARVGLLAADGGAGAGVQHDELGVGGAAGQDEEQDRGREVAWVAVLCLSERGRPGGHDVADAGALAARLGDQVGAGEVHRHDAVFDDIDRADRAQGVQDGGGEALVGVDVIPGSETSMRGWWAAVCGSMPKSRVKASIWATAAMMRRPPDAPAARTGPVLAAHDDRAHVGEGAFAGCGGVGLAGPWVEPHDAVVHQHAGLPASTTRLPMEESSVVVMATIVPASSQTVRCVVQLSAALGSLSPRPERRSA